MEGVSPLLLSLQYRHPRIALRLLNIKGGEVLRDAHVNARCPRDGMFPLFVATRYGYENVVRTLLRLGANPTLKTRHGHSALDVARHSSIGKMLRRATYEWGGGDKGHDL